MSNSLPSIGEPPQGPLSDRLTQLSRATRDASGGANVAGVIELQLPTPPSVNKLRRYNFANRPVHKRWIKLCNSYVLASALLRSTQPIKGQFIAEITLDEQQTTIDDLDNCIKALIDYAKKLELIVDDSRRYMRELHVYWGATQLGCQLVLRPMTQENKDA